MQDRRAEVEGLAQEAEDARSDVEARLAGMTAALDERSASLAAAAAEVLRFARGSHQDVVTSASALLLLVLAVQASHTLDRSSMAERSRCLPPWP